MEPEDVRTPNLPGRSFTITCCVLKITNANGTWSIDDEHEGLNNLKELFTVKVV
jgi:hypothetical protein